jgi:hypothetical protein
VDRRRRRRVRNTRELGKEETSWRMIRWDRRDTRGRAEADDGRTRSPEERERFPIEIDRHRNRSSTCLFARKTFFLRTKLNKQSNGLFDVRKRFF